MSAYEEDGAAATQTADVQANGTNGAAERGAPWRLPLMIAAPVVVVIVALYFYLTGGRYASTDDAYVQSARSSISSNVPGQVVEIDVHENQFVRAGDVLFRLDSRPYDVAVEEAEARLSTAGQNVKADQASYGQQGANVEGAQAALDYAQKEFTRQKAMTASGVSSQSQLDAADHALQDARARLTAAQQQQANVLATLSGQASGAVETNPSVKAAKAALDRAKLNQTYAVVRALQDGIVTRVEQLQVGDYVNAAQPLFTLSAPRLWVEANFKENQLAYMRPGQPATVKIDAYPDRRYNLHVASLSPGTGNSFSVLPAENATGNWVKVVQRLPVRLVFDEDISAIRAPLAAGLSATVTVDTAHRRTLFGSGLNHRAAERR
ncbi:HlyD family secretion protein [Caulobacter sp. S45]|uniref:HlyD family secretion protein n=1 Tax=Caulobacter sp. S45 TaxID=1641861 RepID=UPI00131E2884|nr:HlyD family secretion protein [Caulobacter sp. S45]